MKKKKYHTVGTVPKPNRNITKTGKFDTPNIYVKQVARLNYYLSPYPPLSEMMWVMHVFKV